MIEFDDSTHTYRIDGTIVPGVTELIRPLGPDLSFVDADVLERASEFGKQAHKATELDDNDDLGECDPALMPYVDAWRKFRRECGFTVLHNEQIVASRLFGFAGTLDRLGKMQKRTTLVDIKTCSTIHRVTGVQLVGYERAALDFGLINRSMRPQRIAVQLKGDGSYQLKHFNDDSDHGAFLACLNLYQWRKRNAN